MSYQKRIMLSNLLGTNWYHFATQRTGIAMPNCFTYATARISEIIGKNQPLDTTKVRGAGDLWENHAPEFHQEKYAREGALMIWKGGAGNYGHVAVCEELLDVYTIGWSESNYGGAMFLYQKRNPNGYAGLQFMGYLVHKELPMVKETAPTTSLKYAVGTPICAGSGYGTPYGEQYIKGDYQGYITQIELGAPYPYLVDKRMWVNDELIDSDPHIPTKKSFAVGDWVGVRTGALDYAGKNASGVVKGVIYYTLDELIGDRAVLDIPGICTAFHTKDLFK